MTVRHHTKDKGDEGLGQVVADLMTNGVQVAIPLSEHLPFDLIAIGEHGAMRRVQVRYRASADAAQLRCGLGGWWADRNGSHNRAFDASAIDVLAIYCPSPRTFVYLLADELPSTFVNLRLAMAKNGQVKRTRDASAYRDPWRMFGPATQDGQQHGTSIRLEPVLETPCEVPAGDVLAVSGVDRRASGTATVSDDTPHIAQRKRSDLL